MYNGDEQDQSELINVGYGRALIIYISTAGGTKEQGDDEIYQGLQYISRFLHKLNNYNNYNNNLSFPAQPALSKSGIEQIEEEGGNEEVESYLINKWNNNNIKYNVNQIKRKILNFYIDRRNKRPNWY
ncbi:MAG: hypothetical protein EZS28_042984 [Streblomastix strix]|uniref:Uncharacterized protein n=1 Tax=Streblomastix strix TaxID=222440 RepID=A0A5J4TUE3_9EUKA|nr:MAG: hypothetical protein EZS28_042984 [Streblomastix strix]